LTTPFEMSMGPKDILCILNWAKDVDMGQNQQCCNTTWLLRSQETSYLLDSLCVSREDVKSGKSQSHSSLLFPDLDLRTEQAHLSIREVDRVQRAMIDAVVQRRPKMREAVMKCKVTRLRFLRSMSQSSYQALSTLLSRRRNVVAETGNCDQSGQ
jgi:hypothetical protein